VIRQIDSLIMAAARRTLAAVGYVLDAFLPTQEEIDKTCEGFDVAWRAEPDAPVEAVLARLGS
jgi:hypothetical protein